MMGCSQADLQEHCMVLARFFRFNLSFVISFSIILFDGVSGLTQVTSPPVNSFPTQNNPRITIYDADALTIFAWERNEVAVAAEVSGATISVNEVRIKPEKNKIEISCEPSKPDRKI